MQQVTCIVVGGGYAGIHAIKAIRKSFSSLKNVSLRLVLIDKNPYHVRKVLLFRLAALEEDITIPFERLFPEGVEVIAANVTKMDTKQRTLIYKDTAGLLYSMSYDFLITGMGSVVRKPDPKQGGLPLFDMDTAAKIRETWRANLNQAVRESDPIERQKFMTIAIAGAGISGIETAAELAYFTREEAKRRGLDPNDVRICLLNPHDRLFQVGPPKVGHKLERLLVSRGVTVLHGHKVLQEKEGVLSCSNGQKIMASLCIWTLGLKPNPMLKSMDLPLTPEGCVIVDESYRVQGAQGVYCIGDCAHIRDAKTGRLDGKTCKEASAQAVRLGKVIAADAVGEKGLSHKSYIDFFCFGLGPGLGMVWMRLWGINWLISGKLGWKIRKFTWDVASLL